jgi:hypothetical protein
MAYRGESMSIEAMKLALDALEFDSLYGTGKQEAITSLRQAIAETEKQEPVGWIDSKGNMICTKINESCKPLYTTPQQRTWVGLTDEEIDEALKSCNTTDTYKYFRAIEAKLKEKNNDVF